MKGQASRVVIIKVLGAICTYLLAVKLFWCVSPGVCGSCGLGRDCKHNASCYGFLPIIPGRIQTFSKCTISEKGEETGNTKAEQDEIAREWYDWIESLPDLELRQTETYEFALFLKEQNAEVH